jgi:transcriptional antiterminator RfaH
MDRIPLSDREDPGCAPAWFCARTQSKREHLAALWLKNQLGIEVYVPRIRFRRPQPRGMVWFTEALFPNYLFARFDLASLAQQVDFAPGVRGLVRFGQHCPTIPERVIEGLQASVLPDQVHVIDEWVQPGETVQLAGNVFHGLEGVVTQVMPARQRVTVLLEFLGRQTTIELDTAALAPVNNHRLRVSLGKTSKALHTMTASAY